MSIEKINQGDQLSQSADLVNDNIDKLKELFPEIVTEGRIDFKVLQQVLGEELEEEEEYYRFTSESSPDRFRSGKSSCEAPSSILVSKSAKCKKEFRLCILLPVCVFKDPSRIHWSTPSKMLTRRVNVFPEI